jgi:hypothetical protein
MLLFGFFRFADKSKKSCNVLLQHWNWNARHVLNQIQFTHHLHFVSAVQLRRHQPRVQLVFARGHFSPARPCNAAYAFSPDEQQLKCISEKREGTRENREFPMAYHFVLCHNTETDASSSNLKCWPFYLMHLQGAFDVSHCAGAHAIKGYAMSRQ